MARIQRSQRAGGCSRHAQRTGSDTKGGRPRCHQAAPVRLNQKICAAGELGQQAVLDLVGSCCAELSLVNASTAWHCIARSETDDRQASAEADPRVLMLLRQTKVIVSQHISSQDVEGAAHARCVSTIAWACAKLRLRDDNFLTSLADLGVRWFSSFKPFELANALWGFAKLQVVHGQFFQVAHEHILQSAQHFNPRSLSMIAWAFATVHFAPCRSLMCGIADAFLAGLAKGEEANPVTIANVVWALATAHVQIHPEVLRGVISAARGRLWEFKAHELSIMLWAFARLGACDEGLFAEAKGLLCSSRQLREAIHSQGIANLLWAFARQRLEARDAAAGPDVLAALLPTCLQLLPRLNPVELSSALWAVQRLAPRHGLHPAADRLFASAAARLLAEPQLALGMSSSGASGVLCAFSEFFGDCADAPAPCREVVPMLVDLCSGFGPQAWRQGGGAGAAQLQNPGAEVTQKRCVPTISFIPELTSGCEDSEPGEHVDVAFEVDTSDEGKVAGVLVEVFTTTGVEDACTMPLGDTDMFGVYKLRLPQQLSRWFLCLTLLDASGATVGVPASLPFPGAQPAVPCKLNFQVFDSTTSTCTGASILRGTSTPASSSGSDNEGSSTSEPRMFLNL